MRREQAKLRGASQDSGRKVAWWAVWIEDLVSEPPLAVSAQMLG